MSFNLFLRWISGAEAQYSHYVRISSELSCATTILKNPENAIAEIDRVLNGTAISAGISEIENFAYFFNRHDVSFSAWIVSL